MVCVDVMTAGCGLLRQGVIIDAVELGGLGAVTIVDDCRTTSAPLTHSPIGYYTNATYDILLGCVLQRLDNVQFVFLPRTLHFLRADVSIFLKWSGQFNQAEAHITEVTITEERCSTS